MVLICRALNSTVRREPQEGQAAKHVLLSLLFFLSFELFERNSDHHCNLKRLTRHINVVNLFLSGKLDLMEPCTEC
jgi:hypothetical protein